MVTSPQAVTALVFDASGAEQGARAFVRAATTVKDANAETVQANERLQKSSRDTERAFERIANRMDPLARAHRALKSDISVVDNAFNRARISEERHAGAVKFLTDQYNELARRLDPVTRAAQQLEAANENLRRRYVPLHAVQQQYLASLKEIRTAGAEVFRSETERAAAIERTKAAFAEQVNTIRGVTAAERERQRAESDAAKAAAQLAAANDNLRAKYVPLYAAQQQYLAALKEIRSAGAAGVLSQKEQATAIAHTKESFAAQVNTIRGGADAMAGGWKLNQQGLMQLQASGVNTFQALASGMSPVTVASTQAAQVLGALVQGGLLTGRMLLGFAGIALGAATAVGTLVAAFAMGVLQSKEFERVQRTTANAAGLTAGALEGIATAAAESGNIGTGSARAIATEMAATGRIGAAVIARLTAMTADYAEATQQSSAEAGAALAKSFADPLKAAEELDGAYNFLTASQLHHIRTLVEQGQKTQAQIFLADELNDRIKHIADDGLTLLGRGLRAARDWWDDFWNAASGLGRADTVEEKLAAARERLDTERTTGSPPSRIAQLEAMVSRLLAEKSRSDAAAAAQADAARFRAETKALVEISREYDSFAAKQEELANRATRFGTAIDMVKDRIDALGDVSLESSVLADLLVLLGKLQAGAAGVTAEMEGMRRPLEVASAQTAIAREVSGLTPAQRGPRQAYLTELDRASHGSAYEKANATALATEAQTRATIEQNTAIADQNRVFALNAAEALKVADAHLTSAAAGEAAAARQQAATDSLQSGVDAQARARQILGQQVDRAMVQGAAHVQQLQAEATQRQAVAAAALKGAQAQQQAETQARIAQATLAERTALANASAEQEVRLQTAIRDKTQAILDEAQATRDLATAQGLQQQADQLTMLEAQTRLLGASNEERAVQIAHVQALIDLHKREGDALSENERRYLDQAEAIARGTTALERQKSAIEEVGNFFSQTFERVGGAITEGFAKGERSAIRFGDIARGVASEAVQWFLKLGALNPLKNALTGSDLPTIGGMLGAAAPAAAGGAAGGSGGFFSPITSAISSGFSSVTTGISDFLFGTAAVDLSGGIGAITTAGTPGLFGTFGAGASTFAAAAPWIAAAAAIAIPLLSGMFGRKPSVGKTSVARVTDLADPDSAVFTFDNKGSDTSVLTGVIKAVTDAIESGTERFLGTLRPGSGFDFGYFPSPERGNSQPGGINIKAIIGNVLEDKDRFKGLSEQEAVDKATLIALREMVDYQSATLDEIAANSDATTAAEMVADLDFGRNFDRLTQALGDLGGVIDANTLATAQYAVALQARADEFGQQNAAPIADTLEKARELFPARRTGEQTRSITESGVYVSEGEGLRDRRFVTEGTDEFDRLTSGSDPLRVVTRIRSVTEEVDEQSANYAANMERIRQSTAIAGAAAELLAQQVSGAFEPELRGPVQAEYEQGKANLAALATHFEAVNEQIRLANEEFPGLNAALIDTTALLTEAQATLLANAQAARTENRQQALNAATGLGAANTIAGLVDARDVSLAEDAALGVTDGLTGRVFDAQVRQALEGSSLADLGNLLASGQIVDAGARVVVETMLAERALAAVRETELSGLQDLHAETKAFADAANDNARQLRQAAAALQVDRELSPLAPLARLQEASRQLEAAFAVANDDDPTDTESQDAIARLPDLVRTSDELARDYYASSEGYSRQFARGQEILGSTALRQESIEQQQLGALRDIEAAIVAAGGVVANDNRSPAERAAESGFNFGTQVERNQRIYDNLVAADLPTPNGFGGGIAGNLGELRAQNPAVNALVTAMGYANGGAFVGGVPVSLFGAGGAFGAGDVFDRPTAFGMRGGLGVMGEAGPEAIMPLERIGGRLGVRALLPANDQGAAISGIRDLLGVLRADNAALRAEIALLREVVAEAGDIGAEATRGVSRTLVRGQRDTRQRRRLGAAAP